MPKPLLRGTLHIFAIDGRGTHTHTHAREYTCTDREREREPCIQSHIGPMRCEQNRVATHSALMNARCCCCCRCYCCAHLSLVSSRIYFFFSFLILQNRPSPDLYHTILYTCLRVCVSVHACCWLCTCCRD